MQKEEFCAEAFEEDPARKSSDVQTGCFIRFSNRRTHGDSGIAGDGVKPAGCPLPEPLRHFIASCRWTFAKTMPLWPHEYIVRERVDEELFVQLVEHIRAHGYEGSFYQKRITYYDHDGMVYWTMGAPIEKTIIINRCRKEDTYEQRLKNGTLPKENNPEPESETANAELKRNK
jgi:hypothetical protein